MNRTHYIFIDFENVQETDLDRIADKPIKVIVVLGERHKNLSVAFTKKLIKYAGQVQLVETGRGGKNALDLVLAYHIGETKKADPHGCFLILSRDKGFDSLIGYLKDNGTRAARHAAFSEILALMNNSNVDRIEAIIQRFKSKQLTRAKKRNKLESQILALFGKTLSPSELDDIVKGLIAKKAIEITSDSTVVYKI